MTDTPVFYVPGVDSHYNSHEDVIVLDEHLKKYPKAHDFVLEHEREHADPDNRDAISTLIIELKTDLRLHFSNDDAIVEFHEYHNRNNHVDSIGLKLVKFVRSLWNVVFQPVGSVWRWTSRLAGVRG